MEYEVKTLNQDEALQAKHFLYEVYANQMGWVPEDDNPSKWTVLEDENGKYFEDMFSETATWFGAYTNDIMIGCCRIIFPAGDKLDLEMYTEIPDEFKGAGLLRCETNRYAIDAGYNGSELFSMLSLKVFKTAVKKSTHFLFVTAPTRKIKEILLQFGFTIVKSFSFSRDKSDTAFAMVFDLRDKKNVQHLLESYSHQNIELDFFE